MILYTINHPQFLNFRRDHHATSLRLASLVPTCVMLGVVQNRTPSMANQRQEVVHP